MVSLLICPVFKRLGLTFTEHRLAYYHQVSLHGDIPQQKALHNIIGALSLFMRDTTFTLRSPSKLGSPTYNSVGGCVVSCTH